MIVVATVDELTASCIRACMIHFFLSFLGTWMIHYTLHVKGEKKPNSTTSLSWDAHDRSKRKTNIKTVHAVRLIFVACSCDVGVMYLPGHRAS
jgi:hypothetical protein